MTRIETAKVVHGPAWQAFFEPAYRPQERLDVRSPLELSVAMGQIAHRIASDARENKKISEG